jgi:hypothetical protein
VNWERIKRQIRREAYEYLADFRHFGEALKRAEGWFTLALVLAVIFMIVVWFITGLGFDRLNQAVSELGQPRGRVCKPLTDLNALILIIDAMLMFLVAIVTLGEMMLLLDRVRRNMPREPRKVMGPAAVMLAAGVSGIVYMRVIC